MPSSNHYNILKNVYSFIKIKDFQFEDKMNGN